MLIWFSHRLSTITAADQILVLHAGGVAESGTHEELIKLKGRYATMWRKQIRAEQAAEVARVAQDRAAALREEALVRPGSSGEDLVSEDVSENEADAGAKILALTGLGSAGDDLRIAPSREGKPSGHP